MAEMFEAAMVICFGASWPLSVYKSYKSRTAKGKSLPFQILIFIGYICGIAGKIITHNVTYVFIFYLFNITMVGIDLMLYVRNRRLDKLSESSAS